MLCVFAALSLCTALAQADEDGDAEEEAEMRERRAKAIERARKPTAEELAYRDYRRERTAGIVLTSAGGGAALLGAGMLTIGLNNDDDPYSGSGGGMFTVIGAAGLAFGGFSLLVGAPMLIQSLIDPQKKPNPWVPSVALSPSHVSLGWTF